VARAVWAVAIVETNIAVKIEFQPCVSWALRTPWDRAPVSNSRLNSSTVGQPDCLLGNHGGPMKKSCYNTARSLSAISRSSPLRPLASGFHLAAPGAASLLEASIVSDFVAERVDQNRRGPSISDVFPNRSLYDSFGLHLVDSKKIR
jgi:hypothetical protein